MTVNFQDDDLKNILNEVFAAYDAELNVLAAIGVRTAVDRFTEIIGIDPSGSFGEKLDKLLMLGKIGLEERQFLDIIVDAGSAAAHRSWRPTAKQLDALIKTLDNLLHRHFMISMLLAEVKDQYPAKPSKKKASP